MTDEREWAVRLQFLDEAQDYLSTIATELLGFSDRGLSRAAIDKILRAAHSVKGGAAMMGFQPLSDLAHRIEDSFKVLRSGKIPDNPGAVEGMLLQAIARMEQVSYHHRQRLPLPEDWLQSVIGKPFDQLEAVLGVPSSADEAASLAADAGQDMRVLMFESEVDACLERLAGVLTDEQSLVLREEFLIASQELGCLGEILDLPAFVSLCQEITQALELEQTQPQLQEVAAEALAVWRRSQDLVLIGQWQLIPSQFLVTSPTPAGTPAQAPTPTVEAHSSDWEDMPLEEEAPSLDSLLLDSPDPLDADVQSLESLLTDSAIASDWTELPNLDSDLDSELFLTDEDLAELPAGEERADSLPETSVEALSSLPSLLEVTDGDAAVFWSDDSVEEALDLEAAMELTFLDLSDLPEPVKAVAPAIQPTPQKPEAIAVDPTPTPAIPLPEPVAPNPTEVSVRIPARYLEALGDRFGELNAERNGLRQHLRRLRDLVELMQLRVQGLETANTHLRAAYDRVVTTSETKLPVIVGSGSTDLASSFSNRFDLLEMDRYGELHLLSREIMDSVVQLQEVSSDLTTALGDTESTERELGRASQQLRTAIEQARMRMLNDVLGRFPRLLRELSLTYGKPVDLVIRGGATLVERSVLERLEDPLLHLIRNAFDHGIEDPETRITQGKPPQGTIAIAAGYRGNQTVITLSDDGAGIPLDKIRARALQMGLSPAELAAATENDLLDLIFEPGFSTANRVTELSGRGVGMDIVRSNLRELGGTVRVETELGQGTTFILTVPVSLSIARVLLVETKGLLMAILTTVVEEMLLLRSLEIHTVANQEVIAWEGFSVPLLRLGDRLQFNRPQRSLDTETRPIIDEPLVLIVTRNNIPFALQVERYWGEQEVTTRAVQSPFALPEGFNGCAVLGGGRIVPLMEVESLLNWAIAIDNPTEPNPTPTSEKRDSRTTVMVVDDSINVRRFVAMTLEKAGYRVEQAKDGQEALEKLQQASEVRAVICDIEMPRLDGFGFLAQSRAQSTCQDIPVIMLTSRSGSKHRDLAFRLGAAAYFAKPFKEQELLLTLSDLTAHSPVLTQF